MEEATNEKNLHPENITRQALAISFQHVHFLGAVAGARKGEKRRYNPLHTVCFNNHSQHLPRQLSGRQKETLANKVVVSQVRQ
jgi:hypothetical protein